MTGRDTFPFEASFASQLAGYTLAASAVVALSPGALAGIVFSGSINQTFSPGVPTNLDLNGGGNDFQFSAIQFTAGTGYRYAAVGGSGFAGSGGSWSFAPVRLNAGYPIDSGVANFVPGSALARGYRFSASSSSQTGPFANGQRGFLPVRLDAGGGNFHYGWIDFEADSFPDGGTIHGWAWESDPNVTISAGAVPEPAHSAFALGLLALGAAGVRRYKRSRAAAA